MKGLATKPIVLLVVLLATAQGWAEQPKANPEDEKALHDLHHAFLAAYNSGDAATLATLFTPDADVLLSDGQWRKGRAELEKGAARSFVEHKGIKMTSPLGSVRFLTPDVAIVDRPSEVTPVPEGRPSKIHGTVVYVKSDGKWQIAAVRLMVPFQPSK